MRHSAAIRHLEREIERIGAPPRERRPTVSTGIEALDAVLPGGGLPRGRAVEWTGVRSCGKTALLGATLRRFRAEGESAALIDAGRTLYAPDWVDLKAGAGRFWVVRPGKTGEAVWCADLLLRSGAFGIVVLDLSHGAPALRRGASVRLQRLAEEAGAVFVALGDVPVAALRLRFRPGRIEPVRDVPFGPFLPALRPVWIRVGKGGVAEVPILCPAATPWRSRPARDRKGPLASPPGATSTS
ncbi:MAG: ImuA family protein [Gemmatimonadota bacterium]